VDRLIEAQARSFPLDHLLRDIRTLHHHLHRIARGETQQKEDEHRDAEERRNHEEDAIQDVAKHRRLTPTLTLPHRGRGKRLLPP
jgi:hypothetical protein